MDINKKIENLRLQRKWSRYDLARQADMAESSLNTIMNRGTPPKIDTLESICEAFGITLAQFFTEDEQTELLSKSEKELIQLFRKMPDTKQQALLELLKK